MVSVQKPRRVQRWWLALYRAPAKALGALSEQPFQTETLGSYRAVYAPREKPALNGSLTFNHHSEELDSRTKDTNLVSNPVILHQKLITLDDMGF